MTTKFRSGQPVNIDFDAIRARLANKSGAEYWRSLEEASGMPEFRSYLDDEFPGMAAAPLSSVSRRNFLQVMGASLALAGATSGCSRQPPEYIHPYVKQPAELVPGTPMYYASAVLSSGYAMGVLVESHMGRPTKIEGLPKHPASLGAADVTTQADILNLYDPDRSKEVLFNGYPDTWDTFVAQARGALDNARPKGGEGVRLLTGTITSPSLTSQIDAFLRAFPNAKRHQYDPANRDNAREGAKLAFGEYVDTQYRFDQADVVVSLDSEFLCSGPTAVRYAHDFATRRDVVDRHEGDAGGHAATELVRMYAIESCPTNTGSVADHRFSVRPTQVEAVARALAEAVNVNIPSSELGLSAGQSKWIAVIAADLTAHAGHAIVIAGDHQPAAVHALAHAMNHRLGNVGHTVVHTATVDPHPVNHTASIRELAADMAAGKVEFLLMIDGNPAYTAPADLDFRAAMGKVKTNAHLSRYADETSDLCQWHIPGVHPLESWGDARAFDGSVSLIQPMIQPLYTGSKSAHELFSALGEKTERASYDIVREYWKAQNLASDFENAWATSLSQGMIAGHELPARDGLVPRDAAVGAYAAPANASGTVEVVFLPDPYLGDGSNSNNAWLQELPKSLTKITWDNAILIGPATAQQLGWQNEDMVEITLDGRSVSGPAWIQPGHCAGAVTVHLGYGRTHAGKVGNGVGFNAYAIRTCAAPDIATGAKAKKLGGRFVLARTELHYNILQEAVTVRRGLVREFTQAAFNADPGIVHEGHHEPEASNTLLDPGEKKWDGYAWGMTIDLNKCTGCNACIIACQSENNIPVVGKDEVRVGREMHWLRVDRYYTGNLDDPKVHHQPVPCMQCENAPCEQVCPVAATVHSKEGLNDMVYNRCIGTRYCSNNCPYKVRRFNFYNYGRTPLGQHGARALGNDNFTKPFGQDLTEAHVVPESIKLMRNPDVTVRTRGVMEKCTYCVQRINLARIDAKNSGNEIQDGAIVTACQQTCASHAIAFGNIRDPESEVSRRKQSHRNYALLGDLGARPRTTYLARLTNPNAELES